MQGINLKLQGQFKFDLYRPNGELIRTSEYVDNFITNSGVAYPYHFAFADCFRYLSVGNSNTSNSVSSPATTGLSSSIPAYNYIGSRSKWDGGTQSSYYSQPGDLGAGCGYVNLPNGVSLIRQWTLPDNTGGFFTSSQLFREFMVSPGRPYVTGIGGVKFCNCHESDSKATGKDCSATAEYYSWLSDKYRITNQLRRLKTCDADKAFARVVNDVTCESGSVLLVTYKLNVIVDTGIYSNSVYFTRGDANPNWAGYLNFNSSITQPGVMLINDGIISSSKCPNGKERLQHFDYANGDEYRFDYEYGESFVPPWGIALEPSKFFLLNDRNNQNTTVYISDDNTQFLVNPSGGSFNDTGHCAPWALWQSGVTYKNSDIAYSGANSYLYINVNPSSGNFLTDVSYWQNLGFLKSGTEATSGVMPFLNDNDASLTTSNYWSARPNYFNIRTNSGTAPDPTDITNSISMTANSFASSKAALPVFQFPTTVPTTGIRSAAVTYSYSFENYRGVTDLRARSFVAAYKDLAVGNSFGLGDTVNLVPFYDTVLSGISGSHVFLPVLQSGNTLVNGSTGVILNDFNDSNFNTLSSITNAIYPIINTTLSWNVPCPFGVNGC